MPRNCHTLLKSLGSSMAEKLLSINLDLLLSGQGMSQNVLQIRSSLLQCDSLRFQPFHNQSVGCSTFEITLSLFYAFQILNNFAHEGQWYVPWSWSLALHLVQAQSCIPLVVSPFR